MFYRKYRCQLLTTRYVKECIGMLDTLNIFLIYSFALAGEKAAMIHAKVKNGI